MHGTARGDAEVRANLAQFGRHTVAVLIGAHEIVYLAFPIGEYMFAFCSRDSRRQDKRRRIALQRRGC